METNPNILRLLEMLDNPEAYSEQEIRDIINSDDETRETYRFMVAAKQGYRHKQPMQPADVDAAWQRLESKKLKTKSKISASVSIFYKIAASFIGVLMLSGIAFAAIRIFLSAKEQQQAEVPALNPQPSTLSYTPDGLVLFTDIRLDSMLAIVGKHYDKAVSFGDEQLKRLRIHTKWNQEDSLAAFIENLNELDELQLTELRDTIFVQKGGVQ